MAEHPRNDTSKPTDAPSDDPALDGERAAAAERLETSHELAAMWSRSVVDIAFPLGGRRVRLDTENEAERGADEIYTVHGRIGEGSFAFELTRPLFDALVAELPGDADPTALDPSDAALVVEHVLSDALDGLEAEVGEKARIVEVVAGPLVTELEPMAVAVWIDKLRRAVRAIVGDPAHMRVLLEWLAPMEMGEEFDAGPETRVEVGPIVIGLDDLDALEPGDALAIGTEPGKNLDGRLVRPTGRTLPVTIDTSQVVVAGEAGTLPTEPRGDGTVALGAMIGTVRLTPTHLKRAKPGGRFIMERNADNACALYDGHEVVARGELTLIDGQLGIEVRSLGPGPAPAKTMPPPAANAVAPDTEPAPNAEPLSAPPDDGLDDEDVDLSAFMDADVAVAPRAPTAPRGGVPSGPNVRVAAGGRTR